MTNQHPITPPEELVQQWGKDVLIEYSDAHWGYEQILCAWAARWGADQELEECCHHIRNYQWGFVDRPDGTKMHRAVDLKFARRPKPPSLKEEALEALERMHDTCLMTLDNDIIRRALEALPND